MVHYFQKKFFLPLNVIKYKIFHFRVVNEPSISPFSSTNGSCSYSPVSSSTTSMKIVPLMFG